MHISPELIDLVYDCALDARLWPRALERISDAVGGGSAALLFQNQASLRGTGTTVRLDPAALSAFYGHYARCNPLTEKNNIEKIKAGAPLPINTDQQVMDKRELMRTEFYNDFLLPNGMHNQLMVVTGVHAESAATLNLARPAHGQDFGSEEIALCRALQPHLARAFRLALKLADLGRTSGALFEILERSPHGLFLIGADGRVQHANTAATAMLGDGLTVTNGELNTSLPDASRRLKRLIGQAGVRRKEQRTGGAMPLPRPSLQRPYSIIVSPLGPDAMQIFDTGPSVLVCVSDPEAGIPLPQQRLRDLFGLTAAEAAVAVEFLAGRDIQGAARQLGISANTVRAHLARILDKTQTSRQPQLIRLLARVTGLVV